MAVVAEFISVLRKIRDVIYPKINELYDNSLELKELIDVGKVELNENIRQFNINYQDFNNKKDQIDVQVISAKNSATTATNKSNEIKAITAQSVTGAPETGANASYNPTDGKFTFIIPQGSKGDKGESFTVSSSGITASRALYDGQIIGWSFLDISTSLLYFKISNTSGDWSTGVPFGKGDIGETGDTGVGITSFTFVSTNHISELPAQSGGTDTYRVTLTNATTFDYNIYNGLDYSQELLDNKVSLKGDEGVDGIKYFSSSPIVPTPTTDFQIANKKYVDSLNKVLNFVTVDFNTITTEGLYHSVVAGSSANGMGSMYYYVVVYKYTDDTLTQVAYPYSTGLENKEVWTRTKYAGMWGRWTKVGGGHTSQVNTISNPSKTVGATWGKISFSNAEIETNSNEITYLAGSSSNFYLKSPGEYEFNIQIYAAPPLSGSAVSMYIGLFDLGIDGLSDTLIGVANQNLIPGQHPSLNLSKIVKVATTSRYYTLKWYYLDGNGIQTTLNLQTDPIYCWANCKRI